jgi:nitrite reductase/ring-hydroxylating ferredoxin subunit
MLKEDNELLTRVGPGTPMGNLLREYWVPALLSSELPDRDGDPMRLRLLGEDLIVFRDTSGRVGMLGAHCAHRGASLFFGRNEEDGLRCVYHGWKYDVSGQCMDMPSEPPESTFKERIRQRAYPCVEKGGAIWTYMGPRAEPPALPQLEWTMVGDDQRNLTPFLRECNWMQALEGDIDTAHLYFLHARLDPFSDDGDKSGTDGTYHQDTHPRLFLHETDYGVVYGARRDEDPENYYWRITQFMFPFHTYFPPGGFQGVPGHIWVPLDDSNTMVWSLGYNPNEPIPVRDRSRSGAGGAFLPATSNPLSRRRLAANASNDYMIDREVQRTTTFTGIPSIPLQDQAMTESMGAIVDRTQEHLGSTDQMIMMVRRRLLEAAKALRDHGTIPPCVDDPALYGVRSASLILPREADWHEETKDLLRAFSGFPIAAA